MTTDGVRRKPQIVKVDVTKVDVTTVDVTKVDTKETAASATAKRALDALDALDALESVKGSATASKGKQGVNAALVGLAAVEPKAKKWTWRAAVSGALLGLTLLGGTNPALVASTPIYRPPVQHTLVQDMQTHNALTVRMMSGSSPPPGQRASHDLRDGDVAQPVVVVTPDHAPVFEVDASRVRETASTATTSTPATTTPATTSSEIARPVVQLRGGLPATLATLHTGMTVVHGSDPGDFYCEHAFFTTTALAMRADSSILKNAQGEVLTGFLHVPSDRFTYGSSSSDGTIPKVQAERHSERRDIVGAAIRGFYEDARAQIDGGDFRMLLTGYLQWGGVTDNPTGDFTGHAENVDAAMHRAFGADLLTREGRVVDTQQHAAGMKSDTLEYRVKDTKAPSGVRVVLIQAAQLPVTDAAINGSDASLQKLIERGQPHAVMSMGVAGGGSYQAEFHADDGGLHIDDATGVITHDDGKSPMNSHPDNYALGRAIQRGHELNAQRPIVIATSTVVGGGD